MRFILRYAAVLVLITCLVSCASTDNGAQLLQPSGPVAFEVGTQPVYVSDVEQQMRTQFSQPIQQLLSQNQTRQQITDLANQQKVRQTLFDNMIQQTLLDQEALRMGIGVDPKAVDEAVAQAASQSQAGLDPAASGPVTLAQRVSTARQQMVLEVIARHVTADQFEARHILVQTEAEANQILAQIQQGAQFATLARQKSQDAASAVKGGELGWVATGSLGPEFDAAAFDQKTKLNTPFVLKSQTGYHVIAIEDRAKNRPFDSVEALRQNPNANQLVTEQFNPWYQQLRKDAEANGRLKILVDPNSVPLPFPPGTP